MNGVETLRRAAMRASIFCLLIFALSGRAQNSQESKDAEKRARALAGLEKIGATIVVDDTPRKDGKPRQDITRIELRGANVTDEAMEYVRVFGTVEVLHICGTRVTDEGLARLEPLKNLQVLYLTY